MVLMQIGYCLSFDTFGLLDEPNSMTIAITGSTPNILAVLLVIIAILAKSSADGSILIAVSDKT
jgi:hypothetical protein